MRGFCLMAAALCLAGCATMSDVTPIGQDKYFVGLSVRGGFSSDAEVKQRALERANSFCAGKGKRMALLSSTSTGVQGWTPQNADVTFTCEQPKP